MIALSNIAQGSAVLGMMALQKNNAKAKELNIPSCLSCYLGVTEPAMFGVNLKYVFPFICGMTGSCIAAIVSTATGVTASAIGVGGLPGILSIQPAFIAQFFICMVIAVAVPFVLTYIVGKLKGIDKEGVEEFDGAVSAPAAPSESAPSDAKDKSPVEFKAFLSGKTVDITEVPDETFSGKVLGEGIAIEPTDNILVSPVAGTVSNTIEDSNHALGITMDNDIEILLHIGLDTVNMKGDGFSIHVAEGDRVSAGDKLITFDPEKIRAAGHPLISMMVITEDAGFEDFTFEAGKEVTSGEDSIAKAE